MKFTSCDAETRSPDASAIFFSSSMLLMASAQRSSWA